MGIRDSLCKHRMAKCLGETRNVFGGGGGVIIPAEIEALQAYGVTRIYSPEDGQRMGLPGMVADMVREAEQDPTARAPQCLSVRRGEWQALARLRP